MHGVFLSSVQFTPAAPELRDRGLLGWLSFSVNGLLMLDGVAVRASRVGATYLAYPKRQDRQGREHTSVKPANPAVAEAIERQVFDLISLPGDVA